jgi:hypothetical protein
MAENPAAIKSMLPQTFRLLGGNGDNPKLLQHR